MNNNFVCVLTNGTSAYQFHSLAAAAKRGLECHRHGWVLKDDLGIVYPESEWEDLLTDEPIIDEGVKLPTVDEIFFQMEEIDFEKYSNLLDQYWMWSKFGFRGKDLLKGSFAKSKFYKVKIWGRDRVYPIFKDKDGFWHLSPKVGSKDIRRELISLL